VRTRRFPRRTRTRRHLPAAFATVTAAVFALALALVPVTSASAHDYLVDSSPKAGSTITTAPKDVSLTFDDIVLDLSGDGSSSLVQVTGPNGRHFETGCPKIEGRVVTTPVALGASGKYTVTWQIVSADGHVVSSSIQFDYARDAQATPSASAAPIPKGAAARPACGSVDTNAASTAPHVPSQDSGSSVLWVVIVIAGIIVLMMIAAVIVLVATSRRRQAQDADGDADAGGTPAARSRRAPEDDD
jgi:copper resistance protein C